MIARIFAFFLSVFPAIFISTICPSLNAAEISEAFSTRDRADSGTLIWNQALGKVHPSLQIIDYKPGATAKIFSVGDGRHGSFEPSTYAQFSQNGDTSGNKIRLDLSKYPILNVTSFYLASGWILEPVGSSPLIIYSLSSVRVEGSIWCHGSAGGNATGTSPGSGGIGRCGGKPGGDGGNVGGNGSSGTNSTSLVTAGKGGSFSGGAAVGGGGGGSWNTTSAPANGPNAVGLSGQAGTSSSDPEFLTIAGGAGGGGGSGTAAAAGAGGGGGGGVVIIHAVGNVSVGSSPSSTTGFIYANGGTGGSSNVAGGPGGGGGGGSVQIFSGGTVYIYNTDASGASQANNGSGGSNSVPAGGAVGGPGRSWVASVSYQSTGGSFYTPSEESPVVPNNNTVEFSRNSQYFTTKSMDLSSTLATLNSLSLSPSSSDYYVEVSGSSDDFQSDQGTWSTDLGSVTNKRYLKIKFNMTTTTPSNPTMIDSFLLTFTRGEKKEFDFKSQGCARVEGDVPNNGRPGPAALIFLLIPICFFALLRRRPQQRANYS